MRTRTDMRVWAGHGWRLASCAAALLTTFLVSACGESKRPLTIPTASSAGTTGAAGAGGQATVPAPPLEPVPGGVRRLSTFEYGATVTDVLGVPALPTRVVDGTFYGFDNLAYAAFMTPETYIALSTMANDVVDATFADPTLKSRYVTCQAEDDAVCVRSVITGVGLKLFRRPLLDEEIPVYEKLYASARSQGERHEGALRRVLLTFLVSAQFLYRMELVSGEPGNQPVGPYELASRLSYLLWSSAPDDALFEAAKQNALSEPEELESQATRMWADAKSQRFAQHFAGQWLGARRIRELSFNAGAQPDWTPEVAAAAEQEIYAYFNDFVQNDRDLTELLTRKTHNANAALGKLYGLNLSGTDLQPATFEGDREGYLGLVGYLAFTSNSYRTSVMNRGRFIVQQLLCTQPPPPPPNVDIDVPPENPPRTARQASELIRQDTDCAKCHDAWDPLGIALEHFDPIGKYRETYVDGTGIDTVLNAPATSVFPTGAQLSGLSSVAEAVTRNAKFKPCLAQQVYEYGTGRTPEADVDLRNIQALTAQWSTGPSTLKELVRRLVTSPSFRMQAEEVEP